MEIIRSRHNAQLKNLRRRFLHPSHSQDGLLALEGEHLLEEAIRSGLRVETVFVREDRAAKYVIADSSAVRITVACDAFNHACATESPQGIAALIEAPRWSLDSILAVSTPRLIVLAGLQDPGNVGAILRTAEAFDATGVLLTPGSADPWSQKALRASAGSIFRLPTVSLGSADQLRKVAQQNIPLYSAAAQSGTALSHLDLSGRWALVIGNEGAGIPADVLTYCTGAVHISCPGPVESLNAAVAAAILLYEASRQRAGASTRGER